MDAADLVRDLYEAYQARAWARAAARLHPGALVEMPGTGERLDGREEVIAFQRSYPEPWGVLTVLRVLVDREGAAAEAGIVDPGGQRHAMAAFWRTRDGLLHHGVEYWVTVGGDSPPASRADSAATRAARARWERTASGD